MDRRDRGKLQSMRSQRAGHHLATKHTHTDTDTDTHTHTHTHITIAATPSPPLLPPC